MGDSRPGRAAAAGLRGAAPSARASLVDAVERGARHAERRGAGSAVQPAALPAPLGAAILAAVPLGSLLDAAQSGRLPLTWPVRLAVPPPAATLDLLHRAAPPRHHLQHPVEELGQRRSEGAREPVEPVDDIARRPPLPHLRASQLLEAAVVRLCSFDGEEARHQPKEADAERPHLPCVGKGWQGVARGGKGWQGVARGGGAASGGSGGRTSARKPSYGALASTSGAAYDMVPHTRERSSCCTAGCGGRPASSADEKEVSGDPVFEPGRGRTSGWTWARPRSTMRTEVPSASRRRFSSLRSRCTWSARHSTPAVASSERRVARESVPGR
mmetsp:Transcript_15650/g.46760  ORF Transcript_15650/g.46760 Transcript_15650/m.46760 type:complete len:329 (-) Transcript_15650:827-1813(-)